MIANVLLILALEAVSIVALWAAFGWWAIPLGLVVGGIAGIVAIICIS
jgi:hypothetical protein